MGCDRDHEGVLMMVHSYRYINKHKQYNNINYTLIIEARQDDVLINEYRIEKCFKIDEKLLDEEFLRRYAYIEIDRIVAESEIIEPAPTIIEEVLVVEPTIDETPPVVEEGVI